MTVFGVSVYPDIETKDEIYEYLKLASQYGVTRVFSSLFSVEGTKEEVFNYFKELCDMAHEFNIRVSLDVNPEAFDRLGATIEDISIFHEMGCDILRMDMSYGAKKDIYLVKNPYGIQIEFNASMGIVDTIKELVELGADESQILVCHNFYPQRYTGLPWAKFLAVNKEIRQTNVRIGAFIASHAPNSHGVWDAVQGLPTVERFRDYPIDLQYRILEATNCVDDIFIGNAFATEEEFKSIKACRNFPTLPEDSDLREMLDVFLQGKKETTRILKVKLDSDITDVEKEVLFKHYPHVDLGDSSEWIWRSRGSRVAYKNSDFPCRPIEGDTIPVGSVVMVNDNYKHYAGEVQIVQIPLVNDGTRNIVATIDEQEMELVKLIQDMDILVFEEK